MVRHLLLYFLNAEIIVNPLSFVPRSKEENTMARRQLLTDEQRARLLAPPSDEREIVRYWTLSREDFGSMSRKAERQTADKSFQTLREVQGHLRTLTAACRAMIQATDRTLKPILFRQKYFLWHEA